MNDANQNRFAPNYTGNFDQNWGQTVSGVNEFRQQQFPLLTPSQPYIYSYGATPLPLPYQPYMYPYQPHYPYMHHHYYHPYY